MRIKFIFILRIFARSGTFLLLMMAIVFSYVGLFLTVTSLIKYPVVLANEDTAAHNSVAKRAVIYGGVAFSAYLSSRTASLTNQKIVFDEEIIDDGDGYNHATGVYKVPVRGTYFMAFQIADWESASQQTAYLKVNGNIRSTAFIEPDGKKTQAGNMVILHLNKNDEVSVELDTGRVYGSSSQRVTTFSGYILK